ncbi:hypothetical protein ACA910_000134 [Epithemia clementina (nom. ined.)]
MVQGFVDDLGKAINQLTKELEYFQSYGLTQDEASEFIRQLIDKSTNMAQWWGQLLWTTGRKLEIEKCFVYTLNWGFHDTREAFLHLKEYLENQGLNITIKDSDDHRPQMNAQMDCNQPNRTLGI